MAATSQTVSLHNFCFNISPKSFKKNMVPCNLYVLEKIAVIVFESLFALLIISQPVCSEMSMKSLSNQSQAKTSSVQRRFDFITWTDAALKENSPVSRYFKK